MAAWGARPHCLPRGREPVLPSVQNGHGKTPECFLHHDPELRVIAYETTFEKSGRCHLFEETSTTAEPQFVEGCGRPLFLATSAFLCKGLLSMGRGGMDLTACQITTSVK